MIRLALAVLLACAEPGGPGSGLPGSGQPGSGLPGSGLPPDLASASLTALAAERAALEGRDDLDAVDRRRLLALAWRNRSPAQVSDDLSRIDPADQAREAALRREWRAEHVAYSWDNLNPDAQMEPQPEVMSLTWLVLAAKLPWARNHQPFEEPWIADFFARKSWYVVRPGPMALSFIDQVQIERLRGELEAIPAARLEAWRASLPRPGMSPEEAAVEAELATELLAVKGQGGG